MKTVNKSNGELLNQYSSYLNSGKISAKTKERILKTLWHPDYRNIISEFFSKNKDKIDLSDENEVLAALSEKFDQEDMSQGEKKMYIKTILKEISQKFSKQKTLSNKTYKYITNQEWYADFLKKDKKEKKELELERKRIENQKRMIEACTDPSVAYQHYKSNIQQTEEIEAKKIQTIAADLWKNKWIELEEAIAKKCKKFFQC